MARWSRVENQRWLSRCGAHRALCVRSSRRPAARSLCPARVQKQHEARRPAPLAPHWRSLMRRALGLLRPTEPARPASRCLAGAPSLARPKATCPGGRGGAHACCAACGPAECSVFLVSPGQGMSALVKLVSLASATLHQATFATNPSAFQRLSLSGAATSRLHLWACLHVSLRVSK